MLEKFARITGLLETFAKIVKEHAVINFDHIY